MCLILESLYIARRLEEEFQRPYAAAKKAEVENPEERHFDDN
jgi:hypothetical protein